MKSKAHKPAPGHPWKRTFAMRELPHEDVAKRLVQYEKHVQVYRKSAAVK